MDEELVEEIVEAIYRVMKIELCSVQRQDDSEKDKVFKGKDVDGRKYCIKVYSGGREVRDFIALQARAIKSVKSLRPAVQELLEWEENSFSEATVDFRDGRSFLLIMTWVEGKPWAEMARMNQISTQMLHQLGSLIANVDLRLKELHLGREDRDILNRPFSWNLTQAHSLLDSVHKVRDEEIRHICHSVLTHFTEVLPKLSSNLQQQLIHNDGNEFNIFVKTDKDECVSVGLIDFGDIIFAPRIIGLAVCCAYIAAQGGVKDVSLLSDGLVPYEIIVPFVRGYNSAAPLLAEEISLLFDLIKVRLVMSVVNAAIQSHADPTNQYLLISQSFVPALLRKFTDPRINKTETTCKFLEIIIGNT